MRTSQRAAVLIGLAWLGVSATVRAVPVLVVTVLGSGGCSCPATEQTSSRARTDELISLAVASEFHRRLDDACFRHGFGMRYDGALAKQGRLLQLANDSQDLNRWLIHERIVEGGMIEPLFYVRLLSQQPESGAYDKIVIERSSYFVLIDNGTVPVDAPSATLQRRSPRDFIRSIKWYD